MHAFPGTCVTKDNCHARRALKGDLKYNKLLKVLQLFQVYVFIQLTMNTKAKINILIQNCDHFNSPNFVSTHKV